MAWVTKLGLSCMEMTSTRNPAPRHHAPDCVDAAAATQIEIHHCQIHTTGAQAGMGLVRRSRLFKPPAYRLRHQTSDGNRYAHHG